MPPPACLFAFQGALSLRGPRSRAAPYHGEETREPAGSKVSAWVRMMRKVETERTLLKHSPRRLL